MNSWSLIHGKSLRLCIILYIALLCLFPVSYQNTWGWVLYKVNKFLWVMLLVVGASQPLGPGILARTPWLYHKVAMASQWEPMSKGESIWWEGEPEVQGQACFHGDSLHPTRAALISFRANTLSDLTTPCQALALKIPLLKHCHTSDWSPHDSSQQLPLRNGIQDWCLGTLLSHNLLCHHPFGCQFKSSWLLRFWASCTLICLGKQRRMIQGFGPLHLHERPKWSFWHLWPGQSWLLQPLGSEPAVEDILSLC